MNIRTDAAGAPKDKDFFDLGFIIFKNIEGNDMGCGWSIPQWSKNDKIFITNGYWTWDIKDKEGNELWSGWWNTKEELQQTITEIEKQMTKTKEIKGTLNYTIYLTEDGYSIKSEPKIEDELAGILIAQSLCQKQILEYEEAKKMGIKPEFKDGINNQIKTLNRCSRSLNDTFNLLLIKLLSAVEKK